MSFPRKRESSVFKITNKEFFTFLNLTQHGKERWREIFIVNSRQSLNCHPELVSGSKRDAEINSA